MLFVLATGSKKAIGRTLHGMLHFDIRLSLVNATGNIDYFLSNISKALHIFPTYFISDSLLMERMIFIYNEVVQNNSKILTFISMFFEEMRFFNAGVI